MRDMAEELGIPVKGLDGPATPHKAKNLKTKTGARQSNAERPKDEVR